MVCMTSIRDKLKPIAINFVYYWKFMWSFC